MSDIAKRASVSRQAVYLHFKTRAELLISTTRHIDAVSDIDRRFQPVRDATDARARLHAFVAAWCGYIPEIHDVAMALFALRAGDEAAATAWSDRMGAVLDGCERVVRALEAEGALMPGLDPDRAGQLLWSLLSIETWERLVRKCGWSQAEYVEEMQRVAFVSLSTPPGPDAG